MTPDDFARMYYPAAKSAAQSLGIDQPGVAGAILAQWALESGWGTSHLAQQHNNLGGIKYVRGVSAGGATAADGAEAAFASYPNIGAFVADYVRVLGLSLYAGVRAAALAPAPDARTRAENVITALAQSPYDAGHYGGSAANVRVCLSQLWPLLPDAAESPAGAGYIVSPVGDGSYTVKGPALTSSLILGGLLLAVGLAVLDGKRKE